VRTGLPLQLEAGRLISIGPDIYQRDQRLIPPAADAWRSMRAAAAGDGIELQLVSAYRSVDYQEGLVRRKLDRGQSIGEILRVSAAPGFSEHHTGRAVDVTTPGFAVLEEEFENSEAFAWLTRRAAEFGFTMSYPRDNPHGVAYEPWHWAWWGDR
jgi:D-alanyl-D-alanine carboxypeptidase